MLVIPILSLYRTQISIPLAVPNADNRRNPFQLEYLRHRKPVSSIEEYEFAGTSYSQPDLIPSPGSTQVELGPVSLFPDCIEQPINVL